MFDYDEEDEEEEYNGSYRDPDDRNEYGDREFDQFHSDDHHGHEDPHHHYEYVNSETGEFLRTHDYSDGRSDPDEGETIWDYASRLSDDEDDDD